MAVFNDDSLLDKTLASRIKQGYLKPDNSIDLHGLNLMQAYDAVDDFLQQAIQNQARFLLIITGVGGGGVLKQKIPHFILTKYAEKLLFIGNASFKQGGVGAVAVYLRKKST